MGGDLRDYFPFLPPPPREPLRMRPGDLVRVGFWIMWPWPGWVRPAPACRLVDRLGL